MEILTSLNSTKEKTLRTTDYTMRVKFAQGKIKFSNIIKAQFENRYSFAFKSGGTLYVAAISEKDANYSNLQNQYRRNLIPQSNTEVNRRDFCKMLFESLEADTNNFDLKEVKGQELSMLRNMLAGAKVNGSEFFIIYEVVDAPRVPFVKRSVTKKGSISKEKVLADNQVVETTSTNTVE